MELSQYLALLGLWIAGIAAPGPDVLVILRSSSLGSRRAGVLTAVGVMTGNLLWITLSLTGVTVLIGQDGTVQRVLQVAGALFLGWLGVGGVRAGLAARTRVPAGARTGSADGAGAGLPQSSPGRAPTPARAFGLGLVTNLSNPKAIVFFVALFANVVPAGARWWESLFVLVLLLAVGLAWFTAVAWTGSVERLAAGFRRRGAAVELGSGALFLALAVGLLVGAL
jgi:threonine/homoserine/homoserine lactone efflux protein